MRNINQLVQFVFEEFPDNPDTIIVKNEFYPNGLTQKQIYTHYMKNKDTLLEQLKSREVMFFINPRVNQTIVKRKSPEGGLFTLNKNNYEKLITGRTISIHATMRRQEQFGIIDIDFHNFKIAKETTAEIYDYLKDFPGSNIEIRYTGKDSFHVIVYYKSVQDINKTRESLRELLAKFKEKYLIGKTRDKDKVNIDLSSNKYRGGFIVPGSLSVLGLKCIIVPRNRLLSFDKRNAIFVL